MSDYRYTLDVYAEDAASLDAIKVHLETERITPQIMKIDFENRKPEDGRSYLYLSTDSLLPYGSVKHWSDQDHEAFFHDLSKKIQNTEFIFSGENLDDPNNSRFKKAFFNGQFKDAYQDMFSLDSALELAPWREYGTPAIELHDQTCGCVPLAILTCVHQTKFGDNLYSSIHPTMEAALAHIEDVKKACNFDPEFDEFFGYDIDLQVLDLQTMTSRQKSVHAIDKLIAGAEQQAGQSTPAIGRIPDSGPQR